tara:strand:- start:293 stop:523 length:231 start_codon:yes stop_codon:yes gene_type:complete
MFRHVVSQELNQLLAVVRVQRAWRERQTVFRLFGQQLFVRSQVEQHGQSGRLGEAIAGFHGLISLRLKAWGCPPHS